MIISAHFLGFKFLWCLSKFTNFWAMYENVQPYNRLKVAQIECKQLMHTAKTGMILE